MKYKVNLTDKPFWELKQGDSIYVAYKPKSAQEKIVFLAEVYSIWRNRATVKIIESTVNPELWRNHTENNHYSIKEKGWFADVTMRNCGLYGKPEGSISERFCWFNAFGYAHKTVGIESNESRVKHPSFGTVTLSKGSSSSAIPLFGSNLQHTQTITMTISNAYLDRHLHNDWIHSAERIIEVEMSATQFADMITSIGNGGGTPVTVRCVKGESYPDPPFESRTDVFQREFSNDMKNIATKLETEVQEAFNILNDKPNLTKGDRKLIADRFKQFISSLDDHLPFISQQFNESMEKTTSEAKAAIEQYFNSKIAQLGIDAAQANPSLLLPVIESDKAKEITETN